MTELLDAASLILVRQDQDMPRVLMGKRSAQAAFMPNMYVFPGGRVDPEDSAATSTVGLTAAALNALAKETTLAPATIFHTALREVTEETGLCLTAADKVQFILRAITPEGLPRRFDTRFLLTSVECVSSDLDEFSNADGELSDLRWVKLAETSTFNMPGITRYVLGEVEAALTGQSRPGVPFLKGGVAKAISYL